jgi:flagellar hook-length control protein FliK
VALDSILSTPVAAPPAKPVSSHSPSSASSHSSFGADGASDSSSAQSSSSSNGSNTSDNGNATRNSGQNASSRSNAASSQGQNSASQGQKASSSSQSQQSAAANQAQSTNATSNGKTGAAPSNNTPGASFLQALAQTQANAQESTATSGTPQIATSKGKAKAKDDGSTNSTASFGFLSQSLVAAMAGIQQPSSTQGTPDGDDSVDGVSLSSGTTAQSLTADLMQNTAESLKTEEDPGSTQEASNTASATDTSGATAAASTFQAHLGVSSQSQTQATQNAANTQINTPVGASGFTDEVGDKITWMAHQGVQSASLQMTPEHMGPVEVKISVQDGSATVSINAAHADTRAALEQALPRLREMFSTQGMNLTDASVSQQFSRGQAQKQGIKAVGSVGGVSDEASSPVVSVTSARLGLVDTYA